MKFPYGISNFREITLSDYFYADRTSRIPLLEHGKYQLFIRPRRFGKTLLLSTLFNYYDLASAHLFDDMFGHLSIGKNPTPYRNKYFILQWDFSCVDPTGNVQQIKRALHNHINVRIEGFLKYYQEFDIQSVNINPDDALSSIDSLVYSLRMSGHPLYLLIDEYDNFANEVMMGAAMDNKRRYEALVFEEGPLRTLFKAVKSATSQSLIDRIFITGVSPVVMSDITSGFNIARNIYLNQQHNDLCGFTLLETQKAVEAVAEDCGFDESAGLGAASMIKIWYDGYLFSPDARNMVINPTLALFFLDTLEQECTYPRNMLDDNMATDRSKLEYISQIPGGGQLLLDLTTDGYVVEVDDIVSRFGMRDMLRDQSKDNSFMVSLLYYFGVLSLQGRTDLGKLILRVPNLVIRKLYVEQIAEMLLPDPIRRDEGKWAAEKLYQTGDMDPICRFIEQKYFKVFHTADYRWANELTVKTAFLTLLYNDNLYVMDSELEIERGRTDLTMIIRPDARQYKILDILVEFKFVSLKDAGTGGEEVRTMDREKLESMKLMQQAMAEAREQVRRNMESLSRKHDHLRLRGYAVVSLGFERIWWEEVYSGP
ncbi:AAA family ATPase [Desulfonatronovibrio magnus]|uniref:AAA family ATPase n=1 Tax=Desulfonatronovibrio magnus TaxID=698827 RepID=UPI0005EB729B|nr:AAA family ATPase [Desulfonatronovibrio magnus]